MTTVTPPAPPVPGPPTPPTPPSGAPGPSRPSNAARAVSIVAIVLGGIVVLGTLGSAVLSTLTIGAIRSESRTLEVADIDELDVEVAGGSLQVVFADVDAAELSVESVAGATGWTFEQDGHELRVSTPDRHFGGAWLFGDNGRATLTLPASLRTTAMDASLSVAGGSLTVHDGVFRKLDAETDAGSLDVTGTARSLTAETNAGDATLRLADVETGELSVSAGRLTTVLSGGSPRRLTADVSAGALDLTVPDGDYDVSSDVSAGGFDNRIGSDPGASNTIRVEVSAGSASLRAG
ncbi:MAG: hypothetical protein J0I62_04390 [Microbacterium sp.]|nr:hypothetical protein [Microbacterium sp.]